MRTWYNTDVPRGMRDLADAVGARPGHSSFYRYCRHVVALLATAVTISTAADAQEPDSELPEQSFKNSLNRAGEKLNGDLKLSYFYHRNNVEQDHDRQRFEYDLQLDIAGFVGENMRYVFTPQLRGDSVGWSQGAIDGITEEQPDRYILNLHEAYMMVAADTYDLSIGKRMYAWGTGDGYNPTDNINPRDAIDVPTIEKIGVPSINLNIDTAAFSTKIVIVPWFTPSRVPSKDNRWIGDLSEAQRDFGTTDLNVGPRNLPANTVENVQVALRVATSTLVEGWDLSLTYFDGVESIGVLRGAVLGQDIFVFREFPKYREFGFDFSTTLNKLEIHGEAAAHFTDGSAMDDDYVEYVVGINCVFDDVPSDLIQEIISVVEYAGESVFDRKVQGNAFSGSGEYIRPFKNSLILSNTFSFSYDTKIEVPVIFNFGDEDFIVRPQLSHRISDQVKLETGILVVGGGKDGFLGRWRKNDRIFLMLNYAF